MRISLLNICIFCSKRKKNLPSRNIADYYHVDLVNKQHGHYYVFYTAKNHGSPVLAKKNQVIPNKNQVLPNKNQVKANKK